MKPIIFARIADMKFYKGITDTDKPVNGGSYVKDTNYAHECYNFDSVILEDEKEQYFTDVYVLPEEFALVDNKCHIYMGFFVSKEESEFIKKYGSEQFESLLEEKDVDVIEIKRKSIL